MTYLLDTNIITAILKGNEKAKRKTESVVRGGEKVQINAISYFEIKRGLLDINATTKIEIFQELCRAFGVVLLDALDIFDKAAETYAILKHRGKLIEEADILIASLAHYKDLILVSDDRHFDRIQGLKRENWLQ